MAKIIDAQKLFKSYPKRKVLEDVNFSLEEGKFITFIGSNGAGKSTTMRLLAGMEDATEGEVKVFGENPCAFDFKHRPQIFFIHENIQMNFPMNLLEMVKIYREIYPLWSNKIFNTLLKERKFSIKKNFSDLSRGQKMQFLLIMALAARPKLLLLDEITAVIDIEGQRFFLDHLKKYTEEGGTVVITTNILSELNDYTDHLLLIQETKLMVNAPVEKLRGDFVVLRKSLEHDIFSHPEATRIRKNHENKDLYLVPKKLLDEHPEVQKLKAEEPPRLEDILIFHFNLKKEANKDEELVA